MSRFTPQFLDEIRARTTLSTLVGQATKLQRAGREWRACCPFHDERTPSFYVNDDKGFYHCFGCSAHGDAIRWLTDQRGLAFVDAVKELADSAGLALPAPDAKAEERATRAASLHDVMAAASTWFVEQLHGDAGAEARAYLKKRGVDPSTAQAFGIGFAPDRRDALKAALTRFGEDMLVDAGLLINVDDKPPYDRFRGRLMIPIRDPRGRVIAFGGRILGAGEPKYLNSPDTPLFDKGRTLYNLDRAAPAARKAGRLIVVEGYLDVIALARVGIDEVVAPLGTALTEAQLERLWRVVDVPVLCFDGDGAGRKAAVRAAERALPMLAPGRSLSISLLPQGQDPDDLARGGGRAAVEAQLGVALALDELLWRHEEAALPLKTPEARAGFKRRLGERVATVADPDVRRQYDEMFRARFEAAFFAPRRPFEQRAYGGARKGAPAPARRPGQRALDIGGGGVNPLYARAVIAGLLRFPATVGVCGEALATLAIADPAIDRLRGLLLEAAYEGQVLDSARAGPIFEREALSGVVADLLRGDGLAFSFSHADADEGVARRDLVMAIEALASRPELDEALAAANARMADGADEDSFTEQQRLVLARSEAERALASLMQGDDD